MTTTKIGSEQSIVDYYKNDVICHEKLHNCSFTGACTGVLEKLSNIYLNKGVHKCNSYIFIILPQIPFS